MLAVLLNGELDRNPLEKFHRRPWFFKGGPVHVMRVLVEQKNYSPNHAK
jgi:hypothetical protein